MKRVFFSFLLILSSLFAFKPISFQSHILKPNEAFKPSIKELNNSLLIDIKLAKGIDLTKNSIKIKMLKPNIKNINIDLPPSKKMDGNEVYFGDVKFKIPYSKLPKGEIKLELSYQGCSNVGICYPPQKKDFIVNVKSNILKTDTQKNQAQNIAYIIKNRSLWVILATFFGFGLLLSLTPCVFPMVPILSSIIVGTKNITTKKAFFYSLIYVLSMALAYTIAGVLAGLFGANIQAAFQNPIILVIFALIFVALAFSMFGFYEIRLPLSITTKINKKSNEAKGKGGVVGVAIMGFLSALIVSPCVAPPLAGALIYIGQTGNALLGGLALFALGLGMGAPLLLIGTGAGKFMPKPGGWMNAVSKTFGVVMLGVAIWTLDRVLPESVVMFLWAALFIGSAVYLRAFERIEKGAFWFEYFKKSIGILLFIYGIFLFFGSFTGATNPLNPLKVLKDRSAFSKEIQRVSFQKVSSLKELREILKNSSKPVMVDFSAKWCVSCKELDENTFSNPKVIENLKGFKLVRVNLTQNSKENEKFLKAFSLFGPPAIIFFKDGKELRKVIGYKNPKEFLEIVKSI